MAYQINMNHTKRTITESMINKLELYRHNLYEWIIESNDIDDIFIETFYRFFFNYMNDSVEDDIILLSGCVTSMIIAYLDSHIDYDMKDLQLLIKKYIELILTKEGSWSKELKMNIDEFNENQFD